MNRNTLRPLRYVPVLVLMASCVPSSETYGTYQPSRTPSSATAGALGGPGDPRMSSAGALSGSSIMPQVVAAPSAPMRMSANEILSSLPNNTASGYAANGMPYYAYFQPNGQERFREGDFHANGAWRVLADGRFCTQLARVNGDIEQCYVLSHSGSVVTFQYPDGTQAGSFNLVAGNPQGL
jgi:hypothetical protein